jgi:diketogulonate reductase-like aldo/keto reductase
MNQIELHPWNQRKAQLECCNKHGIAIQGWGPFAKGKILEDEELKKIAKNYSKNVAQLCVRWSIQRRFITIPKSISKERIISNVDVFDFEISIEDMEKINTLENGFLSGGGDVESIE